MTNTLKYLYRAIYNDGSVYDQNINDVSVTDGTKSCYYDLKLDQIHYFTLSNGFHSYILDLTDGGVSINGSDKFYLTNEKLVDFKLVHYREVTLLLTPESRTISINFVIGYEAKTLDGKPTVHYIIVK